MIESIHISGYRALKDFELALPMGRPLVVIGENATGKSTILDALTMICAIANGRAGRAILDRGGWAAVAWLGTSASIEFSVRFREGAPPFVDDCAAVEYFVRLGSVRSVPTVLDEEVRVYKAGMGKTPLVVLKGGASPYLHNRRTRVNDPATPAESDTAMLTNSVLAAVSNPVDYPTPIHVRAAFQAIAVYPSFALGATLDREERIEPIGTRPVEHTPRIKSSGRDLLNALHTIAQGGHSTSWVSLLDDVRAVFPWCESIRFPAGPGRGQISLTWVDQRTGATLYLDDMSEGMPVYTLNGPFLRFLAGA